MKKKICCFSMLIVLISLIFILKAQSEPFVIKNDNPEFEITLPGYFQPFKNSQMPKGWILGYYEKTGFEDKQPITVGIEVKDEILKKDHAIDLDKEKSAYPNDAIIEKMIFSSSRGKLQGLKIIIKSESVDSVMYLAQVPLRTESIVIISGGTIERDKEIKQILDGILKSFETKSKFGVAKKNNFIVMVIIIGFVCFAIIRRFYLFRRNFN